MPTGRGPVRRTLVARSSAGSPSMRTRERLRDLSSNGIGASSCRTIRSRSSTANSRRSPTCRSSRRSTSGARPPNRSPRPPPSAGTETPSLEINAHCRQEELCAVVGCGETLLRDSDRLAEYVDRAAETGVTVGVKVRAEVPASSTCRHWLENSSAREPTSSMSTRWTASRSSLTWSTRPTCS